MHRSLFLLAFLLVLAGCKVFRPVGKTMGRSYDNFTAHYNKFYNAKRTYRAGIKTLEQKDEPVNRYQYLQVFTTVDRPTGSKNFDDAVLKSADVLRKHPRSKWTDDALLLIGKSYYYTQKYVGAEQKFKEVIEGGGGLHHEARFWLARSLIAGASYEEAEQHLNETLAREDLSRRWEPELRLALGELYMRRQDWARAIPELEQGLQGVRDKDLGARAQFLLGQIYETVGRYADAVEAYRAVSSYKPLYELDYAAEYNATRVMGLYIDGGEALRMLRRMERDDNNFGYINQLTLLRGNILQAQSRSDEALNTYVDLLYDPNNRNITNVRGQAHYSLAALYRDAFEDYLLASAHFDTAATALKSMIRPSNRSATATQQAFTPEAITDSEDLAETFKSFTEVYDRIVRLDSLLYLGSMDEETFDAKILEMRQELARKREEERREQEKRRIERGFQNRTGSRVDETESGVPGKTLPGKDPNAFYRTRGFLSYKYPPRVQEEMVNFISLWGNRPLVPNWRRQAALDGTAALAEQEGEATGFDPTLVESALPQIDISAVPRDSLSMVQMRGDRAAARYELGNVLFLAINNPDSAAVLYRMVIEEDGDLPVAQRAYYALAEVQRVLGDSLSAIRLYEQALNLNPYSELANKVREYLGMDPIEAQELDSLALAEAAYGEAFTSWSTGNYFDAFSRMLGVVIEYPRTDVAPRALLASSTVYLEWANMLERDLFSPIPSRIPDSVLVNHGLIPVMEISIPDTTEAITLPPDSTSSALNDTTATPDPLPVDTTQVSDSLLVAPTDSLSATDTIAPAEPAEPAVTLVPDSLRLPHLYSYLIDTYPQSTYAQTAQTMRDVLEEYRQALLAPPDTAVADTLEGDVLPEGEAVIAEDVPTADEAEEALEAYQNAPPEKEAASTQPMEEEMAARMQEALQQRQQVMTRAEVMPELIGGETSLFRLIKYPDQAQEEGITGHVIVQFVIGIRGQIEDPIVIKSLGAGCDEEALRVLDLASYRPGRRAGNPIPVQISLSFPFFPEE